MNQIKKTNRIVVDYNGLDDIILLAIIETKTGKELPLSDIGFPVVKKYDGIKDFKYLKSLNIKNEEGFVIRYESGHRLKIKFDDYLSIHRIISHFTPKHIWEALRDNTLNDVINILPDELYKSFDEMVKNFQSQFDNIEFLSKKIFANIMQQAEGKTRKEIAALILKENYPKILFNMIDGKDYNKIIWNMVKPNEVPNGR